MKRVTKKEKLLKLFERRANKWISVWDIIQIVKTAHHTELIRLIRNDGYSIENQIIQQKDGTKYSSYKLVIEEETIMDKFKKLFTNN